MRLEGWKVPALSVFCIGLGAAGVYAKGGSKLSDYVLVPAGTAKFAPANPADPTHSPQVAFISGDPKTGPVAFLLKTPKGPAPIHWHSSDYYAVSVEGNTKHWLQGKEADAKSNPPGTAWFQPGGSVATSHGDECLSDGGCLLFVTMPGKFDVTITPPAKK